MGEGQRSVERVLKIVSKGLMKWILVHVNCVHGIADDTQLGFGRYGTKSCRAGRLSYRDIEVARRAIIVHFHRAMSGQFRRNDIPITGKPTEVRMGRGKGNPTGWIASVSRGQILFEMEYDYRVFCNE
ncbi:hypothetical protein H5410_016599 [Solanum commersonii]|uniref:Large ribosomal subunit protein uL16m n=1 Tax=Solanum commersonii TaxID=4109 RepID=A0A9J5ZY45_SOLCO|nr:hypothetical protein H5410_016599 [Solanum commersonii]